MALAETIELARHRADAARWDAGEAEVLQRIAAQLPQPSELDNQTRADLSPFIDWTTQTSVRYCPAKPFVIAQYIFETATNISTETLLRRVNAISALHSRHNLADPVSTPAARHALEMTLDIQAPRSWRQPEKDVFATLPIEVRAAVARREQQRETELRRLQNQLAELKRQTMVPTTESIQPKEEVTNMAKDNADHFSNPKRVPMTPSTQKPRDISKEVDRVAEDRPFGGPVSKD